MVTCVMMGQPAETPTMKKTKPTAPTGTPERSSAPVVSPSRLPSAATPSSASSSTALPCEGRSRRSNSTAPSSSEPIMPAGSPSDSDVLSRRGWWYT